MRRTWAANSAGFTLVEIVAVAPMVILLIGAMLLLIVNFTGSSMRSSARTELQNEVLRALDQIEQDVKLSVGFNADTSATKLSLRSLATDRNPLSSDRRLIKTADCTSATTGVTLNDALKYKMEYYIDGGNILRRRATLDAGCATSTIAWQKPINEAVITTNKSVKLTVSGTAANARKIELTATRSVAGQDISYTGKLYVKSLNF